MYQQFPYEHIPFFVAMLIIPVMTGIAGAILPAQEAVKVPPYQGLQGFYDNSVKVEKRFKWLFGTAAAVVFTGLLLLMANALPEAEQSAKTTRNANDSEKTTGNITEAFNQQKPEKHNPPKTNKKDPGYANDKVITFGDYNNAPYMELSLGEQMESKGDYVFTFGKLISPPKDIKAKKGNKLLPIPVTLELTQDFSNIVYKPYGYRLIDHKGNHYKVIDWDVEEEENWVGSGLLKENGKVSVILTYEVPTHVGELMLLVNDPWQTGDLVVWVKE